jgi:hypothetical protein
MLPPRLWQNCWAPSSILGWHRLKLFGSSHKKINTEMGWQRRQWTTTKKEPTEPIPISQISHAMGSPVSSAPLSIIRNKKI